MPTTNINLTIDKTTVGLSSVDNTSDVNKPVSSPTQTALNLKEDKANKGASGGYPGMSLFDIIIQSGIGGSVLNLLRSLGTVSRIYSFQDRDGTIADDTDLATKLTKTSNLSDLANAATARTNLGLGDSATKNVGTSAGTVAEGNDARLSDSRNEKLIAYNNTDLTHTGNTTETILIGNLSIPVGAMNENSVMTIDALVFAVGTANTKSFRFYINSTANTLVGAAAIGLFTLSATGLVAAFQRRIANKNSLSLNNVYVATANAAYENVTQTNPRTALNADFAVQQYLIVTGILGNGADTLGIDNIQIKIAKP